MESPGDFYAMALHDEQLRAGLVALNQGNRSQRPALARAARATLATALRALASVVDAPPRISSSTFEGGVGNPSRSSA